MLENFQLAAIVKQRSQTSLLQIPLHQVLQENLAKNWQTQYNKFVTGVYEIEFDAGYKPEIHERFCLSSYKLPDWLAKENSQTIRDLAAINSKEASIDFIKGIVAFVQNYQAGELLLFQNFTRAQVIRPRRSLLLQEGTYKGIKHPGLTLAEKLSAIYRPTDYTLLFHNFRNVNTFLPLDDFYKEASEQEIREVLNHARLAPENPDALAADANQWFRKRFAMLKDSDVLDQFSASEIQSRAKGYNNVSIQISEDKIVFPANKFAAKKLLQFLNEEIFLGPITEILYETNSKREAD